MLPPWTLLPHNSLFFSWLFGLFRPHRWMGNAMLTQVTCNNPPLPPNTSSWGDILRGYRKTYGAQSFAAVNPGERPDIFNRTKLVQLDVNSKRLYDIGADYEKKTQAVDVERHAR